MSHHLCVAWMRRSIHLVRGYPLRSFKRKCIVLNYSYLNSCIIPGFHLKKKRISEERLDWELEMGLNPDRRVEPQLSSVLSCPPLSFEKVRILPLLPKLKHESPQETTEYLRRICFVSLSGFKRLLIMFHLFCQKTVNKTWWEKATFLCHSCTPRHPEKICKYFYQKGPNWVFLFHSVKILKKIKANWDLGEIYYHTKKPLSVG